MHGTGLRLASHTVGRGGEQLFEGGCDRAVALAKVEKESFKPSEATLSSLRVLFGPSILGRVGICTLHYILISCSLLIGPIILYYIALPHLSFAY